MRDVRQLFFTKDDVLAAVIYFRERNGIELPMARSTEVTFLKAAETIDTRLTLRDVDRPPVIITVDSFEMLATLLNYSFYKKCTLPKGGDRVLEVIGDELVLTIRTPVNV